MVNVYNPSPERAEADQIGLQDAHLPPLKKKDKKDKEEFYSFTVVKIQIPPLEIKRTSCDYTPGVQKRNSNVYYICA